MSIKIRNKKISPKRVLEDPDPILWKQAEEKGKELDEKISIWSHTRVDYLCKQLFKLKERRGEKAEKDFQYYTLRDQLVSLCQKGYISTGLSNKDREWVNEGLTCLLQLYDPLISRISWNFAKKMDIEYDEAKAYAQLIFMRLITGNTPWGVKAFMNQEEPNQDTRAIMANINIATKRKTAEAELRELIGLLRHKRINPKDIELANWIIEMEIEDFPEWGLGPGERFGSYQKANFTAFIEKYLPLRLADIYKRKELKGKPVISLEQLRRADKEPSVDIDFSSNILPENYQKFKQGLTDKERAVLRLKEKGYKDVEISRRLGITKGRVSQLGKSLQQKAIKFGLEPN